MAIIRDIRDLDTADARDVSIPASRVDLHLSGNSPAEGSAFPSPDDYGWSVPDAQIPGKLDAKMAALRALSAIPPFEPVPSVGYQSQGRVLILAGDTRVTRAVDVLVDKMPVAVLWTGKGPAPSLPGDVEIVSAQLVSLEGYLGAFVLGFQRPGEETKGATFDIVLDLQAEPAFRMHQPPQGYLHAVDENALQSALTELPEMVGEFEKPKFFNYKENVCAHSRSKKIGCNSCIDVCSTQAISPDGDRIKVDPHLCMGCGACATVCPSGALSYQYPRVSDRGAQLRALLGAYRQAAEASAGRPVVLIHDAAEGRAALSSLARSGRGLPADVLPLEAWHVASVGLDVLLGAIAYGAGAVAVLSTQSVAPAYEAALRHEMAVGEAILQGLGYSGTHFYWLTAADAEASLWQRSPSATVTNAALFHLSNDKRGTLEFILDHLVAQARVKPVEIPLPTASLYGRIAVDKDKCTLCLACAGACPESALMDGGEQPQLSFLERNCVQCGLCEKTCPENAITLHPRLALTDARKQAVVLNEAEPFNCISCGKVLGTRQMIDNLLGKLAGHSMFQGEEKRRRLQMCADCRVVDMMSNPHEMSILTGRPLS
jgi:ferredoxin